MRVVLYGEGGGDVGGEVRLLPPPGEALRQEQEGPAHVLVRRCMVSVSRLPEGAVRFISPLRVRGRKVRGSDLVAAPALRRLFAWPVAFRRPDLGIILADCDGHLTRREEIEGCLRDTVVPSLVGVPRQEFESWLVGDHGAVSKVLKPPPDQPPDVETLPPGRAKELLQNWSAHSAGTASSADLRMTLAAISDLQVLERLAAFRTFRESLRTFLAGRA